MMSSIITISFVISSLINHLYILYKKVADLRLVGGMIHSRLLWNVDIMTDVTAIMVAVCAAVLMYLLLVLV